MSKKNIYLFEISDVLANQAKLPYSTGLIWSYCIQEKKISENYNLDNWFWYKDDENTVDTIFNKKRCIYLDSLVSNISRELYPLVSGLYQPIF